MPKRRNLESQIKYALKENRKLNCCGQQDRLNYIEQNIGYKVELKPRLKKFIKRFTCFIKERFPEIRLARDLKTYHMQTYIDSNWKNWSGKLTKDYSGFLNEIADSINRVFGGKLDVNGLRYFWDFSCTNRNKIQIISIRILKETEFLELCSDMLSLPTGARFAPLMIASIGVKPQELVLIKPENIRLDKNVIEIRGCPNHGERDISIKNEYVILWKEIREYILSENWPNVTGGLRPKMVTDKIRERLKKINPSESFWRGSSHKIVQLYCRRRFAEEFEKVNKYQDCIPSSVMRAFSVVRKETGYKYDDQIIFRSLMSESLESVIEKLEEGIWKVEEGRLKVNFKKSSK